MKNFLSIIICINFLLSPAYAVIKDDLADKLPDKSLSIKTYQVKLREDELVNQQLDESLQIKEYSSTKYYIEDANLVNLNNNKPIEYKPKVIKDDFLPEAPKMPKNVVHQTDYSKNFDGKPVEIRIKNYLTTKTQPEEGSYVEFETVSDTKAKGQFYPAGTKVRGRIETVSLNKSMGVPSDLIIGSFSIGSTPLEGEVKKIGANRSLWVYPCVYAGSMFFGAGLLLMPIRGGHAKIKTSDTFTLYLED